MFDAKSAQHGVCEALCSGPAPPSSPASRAASPRCPAPPFPRNPQSRLSVLDSPRLRGDTANAAERRSSDRPGAGRREVLASRPREGGETKGARASSATMPSPAGPRRPRPRAHRMAEIARCPGSSRPAIVRLRATSREVFSAAPSEPPSAKKKASESRRRDRTLKERKIRGRESRLTRRRI
jgi:hypothetical protein